MNDHALMSTPASAPEWRITRDILLALAGGVLYFTSLALRQWILPQVLGVAAESSAQIALNAVPYTLANLLLRVPSLIVICAILWSKSPLGQDLTRFTAKTMWVTIGLTVVFSFALNALGWWTFTWRSPATGATTFVRALVVGGQWPSLTMWVATIGVAVPLIEEVVFRFGVLRFVLGITGSRRLAVIVSSSAFAVSHLMLSPVRGPDIANAAWLFMASIVLGAVASRGRGGVGLCVIAHSCRNLIEILTLLIALDLRLAG